MKITWPIHIFCFLLVLMLSSQTEVRALDYLRSADSEGGYKRSKSKKKTITASAVQEIVERSPAEVPTETAITKPVIVPEEKAPVIVEVQPELLDDYSQLRLSIVPSYMSVEGTQPANGSHGLLNSELYPAVSLAYRYYYHNWIFGLNGNYRRVIFEYSEDRKLVSPKHTLIGVEAFVGRKFNRFTLGLGIGEDSKFFYKFMNSTTVDIETRREQRFYLLGAYDFYKSEKLTLAASVNAGINPVEHTDTYDVQTGHSYGGALRAERKIEKNMGIGLRLFYLKDEYKTQRLNLNASEIGLGISFSIDWGSSK